LWDRCGWRDDPESSPGVQKERREAVQVPGKVGREAPASITEGEDVRLAGAYRLRFFMSPIGVHRQMRRPA